VRIGTPATPFKRHSNTVGRDLLQSGQTAHCAQVLLEAPDHTVVRHESVADVRTCAAGYPTSNASSPGLGQRIVRIGTPATPFKRHSNTVGRVLTEGLRESMLQRSSSCQHV
jgi:hypothetical protein